MMVKKLLMALAALTCGLAPSVKAQPDIGDVVTTRPRLMFSATDLDTIRARSGVISHGEAYDGTSATDYAAMTALADGYSSNFESAIGSLPSSGEWNTSLGLSAFHPMMNLTMAWLISGDSSYRTKLTTWLQQIVDNVPAGFPQKSFGGATDYLANDSEFGALDWAPIVWDAIVDSLDAGTAAEQALADDFGEMVLSMLVSGYEFTNNSYLLVYDIDRVRVASALAALAVSGEDARFSGITLLDGNTFTSGWSGSRREQAIGWGWHQIDYAGRLLQGVESAGYTRVMSEYFWPIMAYHNATTYGSPLVLLDGHKDTAAWWLYATTGGFSAMGHSHAEGDNNSGTWSQVDVNTPFVARAYVHTVPLRSDSLAAEVRWLFDEWDDAEGSSSRVWLKVVYDDQTETRTDPSTSNPPLVRHFGTVFNTTSKFAPATKYRSGRVTILRSDWDISTTNQTSVHMSYTSGVNTRLAHDKGGNGHLNIHIGRMRMQAPRSTRFGDFTYHHRKVGSPLRTSAAPILDATNDGDDNRGYGRFYGGGGNMPRSLPETSPQGDAVWNDPERWVAGVIERTEAGDLGGYVRADLTLGYNNSTLGGWVSGIGTDQAYSTAITDSVIDEVGIHRNYVLRRTIARVLVDDVIFGNVFNFCGPDSLVTILDGSYEVDGRNGNGGGIARSISATKFGATKLGDLGDPKRREVTVVWPSSGRTIEYRGGPNSAGEYNKGTRYVVCSDQSETSGFIEAADPSFGFTWADPTGQVNAEACLSNGDDPLLENAFLGTDRRGTDGLAHMGVTTSPTAGSVTQIVTLEQLDEHDGTFVTQRAASTFGDTLLAFVTEDSDSLIAWVMPRTFRRVQGIDVSDTWTDDVMLVAWGLVADTLTVIRNGGAGGASDTLGTVVADVDGYVQYLVPKPAGNITQIELIPGSYGDGEVEPPTEDTTDPTGLGSIIVEPIETTAMHIAWEGAIDETGGSGLDRYVVTRNPTGGSPVVIATFDVDVDGAPLPTVTCDTGLAPGTNYCYQVVAYDKAGNDLSSTVECNVTGTVTSDTVAPGRPVVSVANVASTSITFTWTEPADTLGTFPDPSGIARYDWQEGFTGATGQIPGSEPRTLTFSSLGAGVARSLRVRARDGAGNVGAYSPYNAAQTPNDTTAPTVPDQVYATQISPTSFATYVFPSTDPAPASPPIRYIFDRFSAIGGAGALLETQVYGTVLNGRITVTWTGLVPSTTYKIICKAQDSAPTANPSAASDTLQVTTLAATPTETPIPRALNYRILGQE